MTSSRRHWGALAWLATLQFFVVETVVQLRGQGHSRVDDVISDLGETTWPGHQAMNASFVVQAALVLGGALLLLPVLRAGAGRAAAYLFGIASLGTLLVGVFPADRSDTWHGTGAVLYLVGGAVGLICLAYALRPRSEVLGTVLVLLGLVGAAATTFFLAEVDLLARGATERVAAYVLPIGLALAAAALVRPDTAPVPADSPETSARRAEERTTTAGDGDRPAEEDVDLADPWAPARRSD